MDSTGHTKDQRTTGGSWCVYVSQQDLRDRLGERARRKLGAPSLSAAIRMALRRVVDGGSGSDPGATRALTVSDVALAELLERQVALNELTVDLLRSVADSGAPEQAP